MSLEPGQVIDAKYRVVRLIGEGGMGTVYEGENTRIGRRVAIKVLHAQVAAMPEFVERFEREARAAARIGSSHVCDVLDLGDLPSGDRYIVMEYLDGVSFEDRLASVEKLTPAQLAPIAFELLEGLGTMHFARVIHRDLKPANVFLSRISSGRGEVVKILDFGIAKLMPMAGEVGTMTQTGTMMGTPLYMSPEQARGARDVDGRTDIYAASVMFYRALTGVLPYQAETLNELLFKIVLEDPRPLRELAPEVDEGFAEIVHKGLARDVAQRFSTAREYQEAIASWGRSQGRSSLSFAVTLRSDQPPAPLTPISLPGAAARSADARPAAPAVTAASGGTPLAWSEGGSQPRLQAGAAATRAERTPGSAGEPATSQPPGEGGVPDRARSPSSAEVFPSRAAVDGRGAGADDPLGAAVSAGADTGTPSAAAAGSTSGSASAISGGSYPGQRGGAAGTGLGSAPTLASSPSSAQLLDTDSAPASTNECVASAVGNALSSSSIAWPTPGLLTSGGPAVRARSGAGSRRERGLVIGVAAASLLAGAALLVGLKSARGPSTSNGGAVPAAEFANGTAAAVPAASAPSMALSRSAPIGDVAPSAASSGALIPSTPPSGTAHGAHAVAPHGTNVGSPVAGAPSKRLDGSRIAPAPPPSALAAASVAAVSATVTATAPARPASSARKFRTNLD